MKPPARRRSSPRKNRRSANSDRSAITVAREPGVVAPTSRVITDAVCLVARAEGVPRAAMSIALVSNATIRRLNARHLSHRRITDVIAFTLAGSDGVPRGDVYIAPAVARASAKALGIPFREELLRLVVHGVLHVLGHDHPGGDGRLTSAMWRRQERLLGRVLRGASR